MSYNQALLPGTWLKLNCFAICIYLVYTHCDLGDLSSLVGSLSRTIQQYSPPSEFMWVRCFSHFFRERSFKSRQNPRADFFKARKGFDMEFFNCSWVLCLMDNCLQLPCIRVEEAILWTQRFLTRKFWLKIRSLFMTNEFKRKCLQKLYISSKQEKEWYRKMTSYLEQPSCHFCQHFMWRTTQWTLLAVNLASQPKMTKLYFSSQVRKQFKLSFSGSI